MFKFVFVIKHRNHLKVKTKNDLYCFMNIQMLFLNFIESTVVMYNFLNICVYLLV